MSISFRTGRHALALSLFCAMASPTGAFTPDLENTLVPALPHAYQRFGASLAVEGLTAVVGAPGEKLAPDDPTSPVVGAVHVYRRVPTGWQETARLTPPAGTPAWSEFGFALALQGDTLVVGAHQDAAFYPGGGAVHVYRRNGEAWDLEQTLRPSLIQERQTFGAPVAISGDRIVVGAKGEFWTKPDGFAYEGAAYVFQRQLTGWVEEARLVSPSSSTEESFGWWVDIDADTVVVGAPDASIEIPAGHGYYYLIDGAGLAYVFSPTETGWGTPTVLMSQQPIPGDAFGLSVAIESGVIAVGAPEAGQLGGGAVEIFRRSGADWIPEALLEPDDTASVGRFGFSLALKGDWLAVGAPFDSGIGDVQIAHGGSVYGFERTASGWAWQLELAPADRSPFAEFGFVVASDGRSLTAGYPYQVPADCPGGCFDQGAAQIFEQNQNPLADASATDEEVESLDGVSATVVLDGSASSDGDDDPLSYAWFEGDRLLGQGPDTVTATLDVGLHTLVLMVTDGRSVDTATWVIEVTTAVRNQPPVALIAPTATSIFTDDSGWVGVLLDGSLSTDPDGDLLSFVWYVNETWAGEGGVLEVQLPVGQHHVQLVVSDGQAESEAEISVQVIDPLQAMLTLIGLVEDANLPRGRKSSALAQLKTVWRDLQRGQFSKAAHKLTVFEKLLQVGQVNPADTASLLDEVEAILSGVSR